ncbi:hypothetical protein [Cohnella sp. JJ-181]|uniref:hypothetical protein n=1 Tax=Cohnella rhizoplanae TaxID=2974897 RepID=UPI0022FF6286|nr:hypothetical protein [Cohnella sp. JJ-181]CAI6085917.1 hypothetical protein COHCIP112018_04837 [Cohnella sp. JJ-181]
MRTACSQVAWGLGLTLFDLRIGGFDLLPDTLGFILMLIGLSGASRRHGGFGIAMAAAALLLPVSVAELAGLGPEQLSLTSNKQLYALSDLWPIALLTICTLAMLFGICAGFSRISARAGDRALTRSFGAVWKLSFAFGAVMLFALPFGLNGYVSSLVVVTLLTGLGQLAAGIWLIVLVTRTGRLKAPGDHIRMKYDELRRRVKSLDKSSDIRP